MSQITRCPSCTTLFKVVADQLRISDGWVRCGHCKHIFDASLYLHQVPPPALQPETMPLYSFRAPLQTVTRAAEPMHVWSSARSSPAHLAVHRPLPALLQDPEQAQETRADQVTPGEPDKERGDGAEQDAPDFGVEKTEPERSAQSNAGSAVAASFVWSRASAPSNVLPVSVPVTESMVDEVAEIDKAESGDGLPASALPPQPPLAGYELPSAALPESESEWLDEYAEPELIEVALPLDGTQAEPAVTHHWAVPDPEGDDEDAPIGMAADAAAVDAADLPAVSEPPHAEDAAQDTAQEPSFVRTARRKAFWRQPAVRATLLLFGALLLGALLMQAVLHQRNYLAAVQPQWWPYLQALCAPLHCQVGAYRQISSVVVDSSSFNKVRGDTYQFALTLSNRSGTVLEMPAVELTLTDAQDQPVLRRVLMPQDLSAPAVLAARGEWNGAAQIQLTLGSARIAGYRVLAFYP